MKFINDSQLSGKTQACLSCIQSYSTYTILVVLEAGTSKLLCCSHSIVRQPPTYLCLNHPSSLGDHQPPASASPTASRWLAQAPGGSKKSLCSLHQNGFGRWFFDIADYTFQRSQRSFRSNFEDYWRMCWPKEKSTEQRVRHDQLPGAKIASLSEVKVVILRYS